MKRYIRATEYNEYPISIDTKYDVDESSLESRIREVCQPAEQFIDHVDVHLGTLSINDIRVFSNLRVPQLRVANGAKNLERSISTMLRNLEYELPAFISANESKNAAPKGKDAVGSQIAASFKRSHAFEILTNLVSSYYQQFPTGPELDLKHPNVRGSETGLSELSRRANGNYNIGHLVSITYHAKESDDILRFYVSRVGNMRCEATVPYHQDRRFLRAFDSDMYDRSSELSTSVHEWVAEINKQFGGRRVSPYFNPAW